MRPPNSTLAAGPSTIRPASLGHLVIFNPTVRPTFPDGMSKDERDDLKEAAQILFYTSREDGGVSRERMLGQVGLAKGIMGLADQIAKDDSTPYWSIHSQHTRLIVYSPEPDFYIYMCVNLAHTLTDGKRESVPSAQSLSDDVLVDALAEGYEGFRLLHGELATHLPPTPTTSSLFDRYFTRFALNFEASYLTEPIALSTWIGGYPRPSQNVKDAVDDAVNAFEVPVIVIGKDGPLHIDANQQTEQPLFRHLVHLVQASLPSPAQVEMQSPRDQRGTLGLGFNLLGKRKDESRKSSWAMLGGWVPDIGARSSSSSAADRESEEKTKWTFGLSGLGDAVGSVGTVFGLSGAKELPEKTNTGDVSKTDRVSHLNEPSPPRTETANTPVHNPDETPHVEQSAISLPELEDAVELDTDLGWETKTVWVRGGDDYVPRQLSWIIRDTVLLAILSTDDKPPRLPSSPSVLTFFNKISGTLPTSSVSTITPPTSAQSKAVIPQNAYIYQPYGSILEKSGKMDFASEQSLQELRGTLIKHKSISEIYARTPASQFIVAKQTSEQELYMLVVGKDASLTDAEQAMRGFSRAKIQT